MWGLWISRLQSDLVTDALNFAIPTSESSSNRRQVVRLLQISTLSDCSQRLSARVASRDRTFEVFELRRSGFEDMWVSQYKNCIQLCHLFPLAMNCDPPHIASNPISQTPITDIPRQPPMKKSQQMNIKTTKLQILVHLQTRQAQLTFSK
jgi:hypothetical protein